MAILIIGVGKLKEAWQRDACAEKDTVFGEKNTPETEADTLYCKRQ